MRHRVYGYKLGRTNDERKLLFRGLVRSLFTYGTIQTSHTKAKAIKGLVDQLITSARKPNSQNLIQSVLANKALSDRVIKEIAPKMGSRVSGYTSMMKMGTRPGDQTMMVKMSLIGSESLKPLDKKATGKRQQATDKKETVTLSETKGITKKTAPAKKPVAKKKVVKK